MAAGTPWTTSVLLRQRVTLWAFVSIVLLCLIHVKQREHFIKQSVKSNGVIYLRRQTSDKQTVVSPHFDRKILAFDKRNVSRDNDVRPKVLSKMSKPRSGIGTQRINCSLLVKQDKEEFRRAEQILRQKRFKPVGDEDFIGMTKDCAKFIKTHRYHQKALSREEEEYPLAFSIRMHKSVDQAERLLRTIYMPQNVYCIYIDKKSKQSIHDAMEAISSCFPNVFISSIVHDYVYGSPSPVMVDLHCMEELLQTGVPWKYYLNLAGSEFPLRTNRELVKILKFLNGTNDIEQFPFSYVQGWRYNQSWVVKDGQIHNTKVRKQRLPGFPLKKGLAYNTYSRQFVRWLLTDKKAKQYIKWANDTYSPDETVWATLNTLPEAPGGYPVLVAGVSFTHLSREIMWQWTTIGCRGVFVRQVCIMSFFELFWLATRWQFFANKFNVETDHIVLDCLEEMIRDRVINGKELINWDVIRKLPHVVYSKRWTTTTTTAGPDDYI